jgi:hypothetical protein
VVKCYAFLSSNSGARPLISGRGSPVKLWEAMSEKEVFIEERPLKSYEEIIKIP